MTTPAETMTYNWGVMDAITAAPGLLSGSSYMVSKWPRLGASSLFGYIVQPWGAPGSHVGSPTDTDEYPGLFGWQEAYPGERIVGLGDWDGDGYGDLGAVRPDGIMDLYRGNGTGLRGLVRMGNLGGGWTEFQRYRSGYDYTGDGRPDILGMRNSDGALVLWRWIGAGLPSGGSTTH